MIAAFIRGYGKDQLLKIGDIPPPRPGPTDILVKVHAASVNPIDFKVRNGKVRLLRPYRFPLILGHDCSGEVVDTGHEVTRFKVGDRVYLAPGKGRIGTFAEFIAVNESDAAFMPSNLTYAEAASLPLVALTSWQSLIGTAQLAAGQRLLIHAGSGGVGTFAIQLAKCLGAEVWTTTSRKNIDLVRNLGADHVIDYESRKFEECVKNLDAVFETLGGNYPIRSLSVVRSNGFVISIAGSPDYRTAKEMGLDPVRSLMLGIAGLRVDLRAKRAGVNYRFIFMKSSGKELGEIATLVEKGQIRPVIDKSFSLAECQSAIEYSASGRARGKIVIHIVE